MHLYNDGLDPRTDADTATAVLHLALYMGAPRLAALCELLLAKLVRHGDASDDGVPPPGYQSTIHAAPGTVDCGFCTSSNVN